MNTNYQLMGLVLAGGNSKRMGEDKGLISYHHVMNQRRYCYELLSSFCSRAFLSVNASQYEMLKQEKDSFINDSIVDNYDNLGPMGGIVSALQSVDSPHWLVLAIDQPEITKEHLTSLVVHWQSERSKNSVTCFHRRQDQSHIPEPFPGIYSATLEHDLLQHIQSNKLSITRFIQSVGFQSPGLADDSVLLNINSQKERSQYVLQSRKKSDG